MTARGVLIEFAGQLDDKSLNNERRQLPSECWQTTETKNWFASERERKRKLTNTPFCQPPELPYDTFANKQASLHNPLSHTCLSSLCQCQ